MWTKSADFLPMIESGKVWLSQDVELLSNTQFTNFGHWVEWLCSVKNFPVHSPCGSPRLAFPNVCAKDSFMFVVRVVERLFMVSPSRFEVRGAADVLLHLLLPVRLGLDHLCLIDHVGDEALALEWAATYLFQHPPRAYVCIYISYIF